MDFQEIIENHLAVQRAEEMKTSLQLTLGELILKLEALQNRNKPVIFNEQYHPISLDSWRGSYAELALEYTATNDSLRFGISVEAWLKTLKAAIGDTFYGYKGGEFVMGKTTPIWVANYGENSGFTHDGDIWTQAVIDVSETEQAVVLETKNIEY